MHFNDGTGHLKTLWTDIGSEYRKRPREEKSILNTETSMTDVESNPLSNTEQPYNERLRLSYE